MRKPSGTMIAYSPGKTSSGTKSALFGLYNVYGLVSNVTALRSPTLPLITPSLIPLVRETLPSARGFPVNSAANRRSSPPN